jgi:hypothetical protein
MECFGQAADLLKGVITDSEFKVQLSIERAISRRIEADALDYMVSATVSFREINSAGIFTAISHSSRATTSRRRNPCPSLFGTAIIMRASS